MNVMTTIQVEKSVVVALNKLKAHPRQTYNELIADLVEFVKDSRSGAILQYDDFLHKVQQQKMKELWDNKEDEVWENA